VRVIVDPTHTVEDPLIAEGSGLTVTNTAVELALLPVSEQPIVHK
jgi:hypothetical protein